MTATMTFTPHPRRAPNGHARWLYNLWTLLSALVQLPLFLIDALRLRLGLVGARDRDLPPIPLRLYLLGRFVFRTGQLRPLLPRADTWEQASGTPRPLLPMPPGLADAVHKQVVTIDACPQEWCTAYAALPPSGAVLQAKRPLFVLSPGGAGQGFEAAKPGEVAILYTHGGGYFTGHPLMTPFPFKIANDAGVRVFGTQYRKTVHAHTAYPAPLLDALAAWHHLVSNLGFSPANIILMGDSAGGHLALATARQLNALGLPLPGGMALISPWVDFTSSFDTWTTNINYDYLAPTLLKRAVESATRHYDHAEVAGELFSPALAGEWGWLKGAHVLVSYGALEVFQGEDEALIAAFRRDGVDVAVYKDEAGVHVSPIVAGTRAYAPFLAEVNNIVKAIRAGQD